MRRERRPSRSAKKAKREEVSHTVSAHSLYLVYRGTHEDQTGACTGHAMVVIRVLEGAAWDNVHGLRDELCRGVTDHVGKGCHGVRECGRVADARTVLLVTAPVCGGVSIRRRWGTR